MKRSLLVLAAVAVLVLAPGCTIRPFKDFDVAATTFDRNPFPLNPKWGKQIEQNVVPNPAQSCPIESDSDNPNDWTNNPQFPNCTSFPVSFNGGTWCGPHVNFMPVTYEGTVVWDDHASSILDDDYTLNVTRDDSALYSTAGFKIHTEFNSDETVDNWDDTHTWWDNFHHNAVDVDKAHASAMIDGSFVMVTGLLNLDTLHRGKTELHPVYSMFVRLNGADVTSTSWAFFVRNWGDEGFCGSGQQNLWMGRQQFKVRLPNAVTLTARNVWSGAQNEDNIGPMNVTVQRDGDGVLLTFTLLTPDKQSWFVGDLTFTTNQPVIANVAARAADTQQADVVDAPDKDQNPELEGQIERLPESAKRELNAQLASLFPRKKPMKVEPTILSATATRNAASRNAPVKVVLDRDLVRPQQDSAAKLRREKKLQFAKKFLADRGIQ